MNSAKERRRAERAAKFAQRLTSEETAKSAERKEPASAASVPGTARPAGTTESQPIALSEAMRPKG